MNDTEKPIRLKCVWCMKRTQRNPCEHCGSEQVYDMDKPHSCEWSRLTINTVECKLCERVLSWKEYEQELTKKANKHE